MRPGNAAWIADLADRSRRRFAEWELAALPRHLQRDGIHYYYLSVWPGLRELDPVETLTLPDRPGPVASAYLHIPFCTGRCSFCSYFLAVVRPGDQRIRRYAAVLRDEIDNHAAETELALSYLYFGGGTPTLLDPRDLELLLTTLKSHAEAGRDVIGTVEAHPEFFGDTGRATEVLDVLKRHGMRRVSIGFETSDPELLGGTKRRHGREFLADAISLLRDRGFLVNVDLMYGLPHQGLESWLDSLGVVVGLSPDSISTYCTFIDYGTPMYRAVERGKLEIAGHELVQTQHIAAQVALEEAGYEELPNDFYTKTTGNRRRYRQDSLPSSANTLACGPGSYGYFPGVQYFNEFSFSRYEEKIRRRENPMWRAAALTSDEELRRDIMFSLKNAPELAGPLFAARHGVRPWDAFPEQFAELLALDLVTLGGDRAALTAKGRLVVEEIACLFMTKRRASSAPPISQRRTLRKHHFAPTYAGPVRSAPRGR